MMWAHMVWPDGSLIEPGQKVRSVSRFKDWDKLAGIGEVKKVTSKRVIVAWSGVMQRPGAYVPHVLERAA